MTRPTRQPGSVRAAPHGVVDRASPRQLRALHALAKRRGLDHEDLRALCGVQSLKLLSASDAAWMIDTLQSDRPTRGRRFRPHVPTSPRSHAASGPTSGASKRQRQYIRDLWHQLEYPPARLAGWLATHVGPVNLDEPHVCPFAARRAINQLQEALEKLARERGWYFRRFPGGHELDKRNRDPAAQDFTEDQAES